MRQQETRVTAAPQQASQGASRRVQSQQAQGQVDNIPSYIPQMHDPDLEGLLKGLSQFQPTLDRYTQKVEGRAAERGTLHAAAGDAPQESNTAYHDAYFHTDGLVKGQEDGAQLITRYKTEFDKDKGDLEKWLAENYQGRLKNIQDENYISGYTKGTLPALQEIRKAHSEYQQNSIVSRVESNQMQLIEGGVRTFINRPKPGPGEESQTPEADFIHNLQQTASEKLKVSDTRFQELLFESVKRIGDEGHFDAYDILKKPRPDGSPGLYYDPAWKPKIDAAELHSFTAASVRAEQDRKNRYNTGLYDVFAEEDPVAAQFKFRALKQQGIFKGDAEGLIKWEKLLTEKVDGKPDITQLSNEGSLLSKIYKGGMSYEDVLKEEGAHNITSGQRKYLLGEIRKVNVENRTLAAQEGKASEAIYKSKDFGSATEYIEGVLKPRPRDPYSPLGQKDLEFDHLQLAQARREFFTAAQGKQPGELQDLADSVAQRYLKRRQEADKGGMTPAQKDAATRGIVPYKSLAELVDAGRRGVLSPDEYSRYSTYLKESNGR